MEFFYKKLFELEAIGEDKILSDVATLLVYPRPERRVVFCEFEYPRTIWFQMVI